MAPFSMDLCVVTISQHVPIKTGFPEKGRGGCLAAVKTGADCSTRHTRTLHVRITFVLEVASRFETRISIDKSCHLSQPTTTARCLCLSPSSSQRSRPGKSRPSASSRRRPPPSCQTPTRSTWHAATGSLAAPARRRQKKSSRALGCIRRPYPSAR